MHILTAELGLLELLENINMQNPEVCQDIVMEALYKHRKGAKNN